MTTTSWRFAALATLLCSFASLTLRADPRAGRGTSDAPNAAAQRAAADAQ